MALYVILKNLKLEKYFCGFPSEARQKNRPKAGFFVGRSAFTADDFEKNVPRTKKVPSSKAHFDHIGAHF